jgi:hypothetical protein
MHKSSPTLVLVTCKRMFATAMLDSWRKPFEAEFPHLKCYEVRAVRSRGRVDRNLTTVPNSWN